jgi:hypothetical protein
MAARKSSAEPMSLTATCGEVTVVGICGFAPDGLWSVADIGTFGTLRDHRDEATKDTG